jgi:uncharacterized SAM-binding protein YcdF (DUF218 family)
LTGNRTPGGAHTRRKTRPMKRKGRSGGRRGWRLGWRGWLIVALCATVLGILAWAALAREFAPTSNTSLTHFDAIIVLGSPSDDDGNPGPTQLARVTEGVHEYERGVAPRLILSGGKDTDRPVEAQVMARTAEAQGIPASAIFEEGKSKDTIENGCYSVGIMKRHGWHSAEVVSSASHLPRAGLIFSELPMEFRTHAAPSLERESTMDWSGDAATEILKTVHYLVWAHWTEKCRP